MATLMDGFADNFAATLNAVTQSVLYTDIKKMYLDGILQKDQYDKILISFHEKMLQVAGSTAESIAVKGYKLDEIIQSDLDVKAEQIAASQAETLIRSAQSAKDLLVKTEQITASQAETAVKNAQSAKDLLVKTEQITASQAETAVKNAQSAKDLLIKDKQIATEQQRLALMSAQTIGFNDNVKIEFNKAMNEAIGMIESGGNDAPQALWNSWTSSVNLIQSAASR